MTRKITTILLALALCLTLLPVGAGAASTTDGTLLTDTVISSLNKDDYKYYNTTTECYVLDGGTYKLGDDVTIDKPLIIQGGTAANPVTLDLNGYVLKYENNDNPTKKSSVIVVANNAYFVLQDTATNPQTRYATKPSNSDAYSVISGAAPSGEYLSFTGGVITGGTGTNNRGGVFVGSKATFTMNGGNIVGCTTSGDGGGVFMESGTDSNNAATFNMTGGSIVDCKANEGGGVKTTKGSTFDMTNASIENCTAANSGGVHCGGSFTMNGNSTIKNCTANADNGKGGGVRVAAPLDATATFTMKGGTITGCTAKSNQGDGVFVGVNNGYNIMDAQGGRVDGSVYVYGDASQHGVIKNSSTSGNGTQFNGEVTNAGEITGGVFNGKVNNIVVTNGETRKGEITGGVFNGEVTNAAGCTITGGVFNGGIVDGDSNAMTPANAHTVTFNWNYTGASEPNKIVTVVGSTVLAEPTKPSRDGYKFDGWYKEQSCTSEYTFGNAVSGDMTLYAKWVCAGHTGGTATCTKQAECTVCGKPYGEKNASNHADQLLLIPAKAATVGEAGHSEYWYCNYCEKYFSDRSGTTEITQESTVIPALTQKAHRTYRSSAPTISAELSHPDAASATDYTSGIYGLTFRSTASFASFRGVQVDGKTIASTNYIAEEGSIVVYLKAAYLQTLAKGSHTVTILSTEGNVTANFTIGGVQSAKTGDPGVMIYAVMALTSYTGTALVVRGRKRK